MGCIQRCIGQRCQTLLTFSDIPPKGASTIAWLQFILSHTHCFGVHVYHNICSQLLYCCWGSAHGPDMPNACGRAVQSKLQVSQHVLWPVSIINTNNASKIRTTLVLTALVYIAIMVLYVGTESWYFDSYVCWDWIMEDLLHTLPSWYCDGYAPNRHACFFQEVHMLGLDHGEHVKDSQPDRLVNPHKLCNLPNIAMDIGRNRE